MAEANKVQRKNRVRTAVLKATGADVLSAGFNRERMKSRLSAQAYASLQRQPPRVKPKKKKN